MNNYNEKANIDEYVRNILRGIKNDVEFRKKVSEFDTERPTRLDRTLAAIYLWGYCIRVREAVEVMVGRKIKKEEILLQRYIERKVEEAWEEPNKLADIVESFYEWGKE